jgi:hypothetical protein
VSKGQVDVTLNKAQALLVDSTKTGTTDAEQLEVDVRHALTVLEERLSAGGRAGGRLPTYRIFRISSLGEEYLEE